MIDLKRKEQRIRKNLACRKIRFSSYEDGKSGPTHRTLADAYRCKKPRERFVNRRMIRSIKNARYVVGACGAAIVLIAPAASEDPRRPTKNQAAARFVANEVREIRARCLGGESQSSVARRFDVSPGTISQILSGKTYRWVT